MLERGPNRRVRNTHGSIFGREPIQGVQWPCITSIRNTREQEVEILNPEVQLTELEDSDGEKVSVIGCTEQNKDRDNQSARRGERDVGRLRTDHLNNEETKSLFELRFDYQDVFYLLGDRLSSTNTARHSIPLEPGVAPINACPYRLPKSQKKEADQQVRQLLEEGIIAKSDSHGTTPSW